MEDITRRAEYIADLRTFADWLEAHPDIPAPHSLRLQYSVSVGRDEADAEAEMLRVAGALEALGPVSRSGGPNHASLEAAVGPRGTYVASASTYLGRHLWDEAMEHYRELERAATGGAS